MLWVINIVCMEKRESRWCGMVWETWGVSIAEQGERGKEE